MGNFTAKLFAQPLIAGANQPVLRSSSSQPFPTNSRYSPHSRGQGTTMTPAHSSHHRPANYTCLKISQKRSVPSKLGCRAKLGSSCRCLLIPACAKRAVSLHGSGCLWHVHDPPKAVGGH